MAKIIKFLIGLYLLSAIGVWALFSQKNTPSAELANELMSTKTMLSAEKIKNAFLDEKLATARTNATFLSVALCPTLETTDKNALCMKNGNEWFSQIIQTGSAITDATTKSKMNTLIASLSSKNSPTSKQLYEMLKPIESGSLKALTESLK